MTHQQHEDNVCVGTIIYPHDDAFQQQATTLSQAPFNSILPVHFQQPQHHHIHDHNNNNPVMQQQVVWATNPHTGHTVMFPVVPAVQQQQQQYSASLVAGTLVVGASQPQPASSSLVDYPEPNTDEWSTGLFDCFRDCDGTMEGLFCARCQLSRQYNYLANGQKDIDFSAFFFSCVADALAAPVGIWALTWWTRRGVRRRYGIKGNDLTDCIQSSFCSFCATSQQYREMSIRGAWPTGCCIEKPYSLPPQIRAASRLQHQQQQQQQQDHNSNTSMM